MFNPSLEDKSSSVFLLVLENDSLFKLVSSNELQSLSQFETEMGLFNYANSIQIKSSIDDCEILLQTIQFIFDKWKKELNYFPMTILKKIMATINVLLKQRAHVQYDVIEDLTYDNIVLAKTSTDLISCIPVKKVSIFSKSKSE